MPWTAAAAGNGVWVSLRDALSGTEYLASLITLDGTHDGSSYASWQPRQTFSINFSGVDLIAAGAVPKQDLRVNIYSKNDPDSTNWVDGTVHGW